MNVFKVGEETHILDGYNEDCTVFEVDEAGLNIFYYYSSPTEEEMRAFEPGAPGEIRLARMDDILFLFCKLRLFSLFCSERLPGRKCRMLFNLAN